MKKPLSILPVAAIAALGVAAPNALAYGSINPCAAAPTTTSFSFWGDDAQYAPFKGASFETGPSGWSWGNKANIVTGDDDHLLATSGSHAVNLPADGTAKSPWTCVDSTMPSMRFFVRRISGTGNLTVNGVLEGVKGQVTTIAAFQGTDAWQPSPVVVFPQTFASAYLTGSVNVQFSFTSDPGTVYRIDDVQMDPFRSR
jgi:hypothetical protein